MDDDVFAWKNPRPCAAPGCERFATVGYNDCAIHRLTRLVARHPAVIGAVDPAVIARLTEKEALEVERPFHNALNASATARAALARVLGTPTVVRPEGDGDDVVCTFGPAAEGRHAHA